MNKDIRTAIIILDTYMVNDALMDKLHKLWAMCITRQRILGVLCFRGVCLFFLQLILQHAGMLQELLLVKELAELVKEIQRQHIDIVNGANEICLELLNLPTDIILLLCWVLIDEEVIEQVTVLRVLETRTVQFIIKLLDSLVSAFLMLSI